MRCFVRRIAEYIDSTPAAEPLPRAVQADNPVAPGLRTPTDRAGAGGSARLSSLTGGVRLFRENSIAPPGFTAAGLAAWEAAAPIDSEERAQRRVAAAHIRSLATRGSGGGLWIEFDLSLSTYTKLTALPVGLRVGGNLVLRGCTALRVLPGNLCVGGDLDLSHCSDLVALPAGLRVGRNLYLGFCTALVALPAGVRVGGSLYLCGCHALVALSADLRVDGSAYLRDCAALSTLPADLSVGGNLEITGCPSLTALPDEVRAWGPRRDGTMRHIGVEDTGLSETFLTRWRAVQPPPVGILFDFIERPAPREDVADLAKSITRWASLLPPGMPHTLPDTSAWALDAEQERDLIAFLTRLRGTADFRSEAARADLAVLVMGLWVAMHDAAFRAIALVCVHDALTSCGDRIALVFNHIQLTAEIDALTKGGASEAAWRALGLGRLKLEVVHTHAVRTIAALDRAKQRANAERVAAGQPIDDSPVEDIEVYLAYETRLRDRLGLPVAARGMLYERCAMLTDAMLDAAYDDAVAAANSPEKVAAFLATFAPWQTIQRRAAIQDQPWETLPHQAFTEAATHDKACCLTQEPYASMTKPVVIPTGDGWLFCEYDALVTWWIDHGTHPVLVREPLTLESLRRPLSLEYIRSLAAKAAVTRMTTPGT